MPLEDSDRALLLRFVGIVQEVLGAITEHPEEELDTDILDDPALRRLLREIRPEILGRLGGFEQGIKEKGFPAFEERAEAHGLAGPQLAFKVGVVEALAFRWRGARKRGKANGMVLKWLKKLLAAIDAILDSVERLLPPIGIVKEVKGVIESLID